MRQRRTRVILCDCFFGSVVAAEGHHIIVLIVVEAALINPEVIKTEGKIKVDYEGSLSVPVIYGLVPRPTKAKIKAQLEDGTEVRIKVEQDLARVLLHEIDHLNGILFIDHIKDQTDAFYKLNDKGDLEPVDYDKEIKNNKKLFPDE